MSEKPKQRVWARWVVLAAIILGLFLFTGFFGIGLGIKAIMPEVFLPGEKLSEAPLFGIPGLYMTNTFVGLIGADLVVVVLAFGVYRGVKSGKMALTGISGAIEALMEMLHGIAFPDDSFLRGLNIVPGGLGRKGGARSVARRLVAVREALQGTGTKAIAILDLDDVGLSTKRSLDSLGFPNNRDYLVLDRKYFPIQGYSEQVEVEIPISQYMLSQNFPNPYNPSTNINYFVPKESFVSIKVYDFLGREVVTLVNETKSIGSYEIVFDAANLPSGTYFYTMIAGLRRRRYAEEQGRHRLPVLQRGREETTRTSSSMRSPTPCGRPIRPAAAGGAIRATIAPR